MRNREILRSLPAILLAWAPFAAALNPLEAFAGTVETRQASVTPSAPADQQLPDAVEKQGPFLIGRQPYTVVLRNKVLPANGPPAAKETAGRETLVSLEILDAGGQTVYQETFPYVLANGHFSQALTASVSLLSGRVNAALVIRFIDQPPAVPGAEELAKESWQVLGSVNGRLTLLGAVLPLGQGGNIAVGGVVAGVMVPGGIDVEPLATTAEVLGFRAWTGNFDALVPVRVDWVNGQWGEGEQCYALAGGTLRERGCSMAVEAHREPQPDITSVRLFAATDADSYHSQEVEVRPDSQVDFLEALAIVHWEAGGGRVGCTFDNLWLRTRVDGAEGWVHGEDALEALGLPRRSPK
jgi:hypothetical protein